MRNAILCAFAGLLLHGCALSLDVGPGQTEEFEIKCSAPSHIVYRLDGEVRFARHGSKPLPANIRCVDGVLEVAP